MNTADALAALLHRLAAAGGETTLLSERELNDWPKTAVAQLKAERLLVKGPPAESITCPGCEQECTMAVELATTAKDGFRAFVVCDKRDDVGRVPLALDLLGQWTSSPELVADVLARILGLRRSDGSSGAQRWDVGVFKGTKHSAHIVLDIERELRLTIAGHSLPLADVLDISDKGLHIERRVVLRCVDNPVAAQGGTESTEQRRDRLRLRARDLKASGVKAFIKALAAEENLTDSRIKQLLAEKKPVNNWLDLSPAPKGATSKKSKPQR